MNDRVGMNITPSALWTLPIKDEVEPVLPINGGFGGNADQITVTYPPSKQTQL